MVTKDPGILQPGQWKLEAAVKTVKGKDGSQATELPVITANVAISKNLQFGAAYRYVHADPGGASAESDFGNPAVGIKWRLYNRNGLQIAFAPAHIFGISATAASLGVGSDSQILTMPIIVGYSFGQWALAGELAYAAIEDQEDEVAYGLLLGRPIGHRAKLMFEVFGATNSEFDDNFLNFNIGAAFTVTDSWHVLLSVGSGVSEPTGAKQLDYMAFFGIRHLTGA